MHSAGEMSLTCLTAFKLTAKDDVDVGSVQVYLSQCAAQIYSSCIRTYEF
jgi:hypothetical protein